ncbi:lipopolysaccharide biosynthesis protein [Compostibacter hankyongensis]|uniref:lipopolysaccharide biosynthesis protein n=1 Tax=Compostibacter hankyongensis TaxID=1007089 RepID=UPI0031EB99EB
MKIVQRLKIGLKSDFNKNFAVLFSGSVIAQSIPLAASIILARIYPPEDFGILAVYTALVQIFTSIANLRYEFTIPLPKEDEDAINLSFLSIIIAISVSLLLLMAFILFTKPILHLIGGEKLGNWIFFVPLSIFLGGLYNMLNYFSVRFKKYKTIAGSNILKAGTGAVFQSGLGIVGLRHSGLIIGNILSNLSGNLKMIRHFLSYKSEFKAVNKNRIWKMAKRYKDFPLISTWGIFLNSSSININNFFISNLFGVNQLGFYSYSYRYLNIPLSLISTNMGQLFFQICADCHKEKRDAKKEFISTLKKLLTICTPFFLILYFIVVDVLAFVFGEKWRIAGVYAQILLPLFFIRTIFSPLSMINGAFEKQRLALLIQSSIFFTNIISFLISYQLHLKIESFLHLYMILGVTTYTLNLYVLYLVAIKRI